MSRASRHRILAAMLSACLLSLLGGCTPLTVLAVLGGCKDGGSNGSSGGVTGSVTTGEVRDGMTIAQTKAAARRIHNRYRGGRSGLSTAQLVERARRQADAERRRTSNRVKR